MNRRVWGNMPRPTAGLALWGRCWARPFGGGRLHRPADPSAIRRGDRRRVIGVKTIGDVTTVGNAEPLALGNVGLVVGLEGTGGEPANSNYRTNLEDDLSREKIKDIKKELANPNHALVVVTALLPPGAAVGDPIDVEVALPPQAGKATSLRSGYLAICTLYNYDYTKHLDPNYGGSNLAIKGEKCTSAKAPCWWASAKATRPPATGRAAFGAAAAASRPTRCAC